MKVVNIKNYKGNIDRYIGRPSIFGNPFIIGRNGNREEVILKYEDYARNSIAVLEAIKDLKKNDVLGCYCSPKACHGDIIIKIWEELNSTSNLPF